jgi:hypothetical protein
MTYDPLRHWLHRGYVLRAGHRAHPSVLRVAAIHFDT